MNYHNNSHEWEQLYHQEDQIIPPSFPNAAYESNGRGGGGPIPKPIRRRSRASKRTPTTLLNANTSNFRALVQQFTGCPNPSVATLSFGGTAENGKGKGPVNLNFGQGSVQNYSATTAATTTTTTTTTTLSSLPSPNPDLMATYNHHQQHDQQNVLYHQQYDQQAVASSVLNHNNYVQLDANGGGYDDDDDQRRGRNFGMSSEEPLLIDHLSMNELIATEYFSILNNNN